MTCVAVLGLGQRRVHLAGDVLGHESHLRVRRLAPAEAWRKLMLLMSPLVPLAIMATKRRVLVLAPAAAAPCGGSTCRSSRPRCGPARRRRRSAANRTRNTAIGRPPGSRSARIETVGSVGPAGSTRSGLPAAGFIFTWSMPPNGLGGIVPGFRNHRRLKTCSGTSAVAKAICAGRRLFTAHFTPSAMRRATKRW